MGRISFIAAILAALCFAGPLAPTAGQEKKPASLRAGDPAPAWKVNRWLQGQEAKTFEPGKIYVVEFWATWCGPLIAFMPHLAAVQAEYKTKNVTVIGFTSGELQAKLNHTEKELTEFMARRAKKFGYSFAYADDGTTSAWLAAAGREGIPCNFVIDKTG